MLTVREFAQPKPAPEPYYRRRIAELVAAGLARYPSEKRPDHERTQGERMALRLSYTFASRLVEFQDMAAYYSPGRCKLSFRRTNPKPNFNGKTYVPPLPAGVILVGRYSYPFSRREFMRDLLAIMGGRP